MNFKIIYHSIEKPRLEKQLVDAYQNDNYKKVITLFKQLLENDPQNEMLRANLAIMYYETGALYLSLSTFSEISEDLGYMANALDPFSLYVLGKLLKDCNMFDEALNILSKAINKANNDKDHPKENILNAYKIIITITIIKKDQQSFNDFLSKAMQYMKKNGLKNRQLTAFSLMTNKGKSSADIMDSSIVLSPKRTHGNPIFTADIDIAQRSHSNTIN